MRYFFITGTSSGIGRALCEELFQFSDVMIYGFARRQSLQNERYVHHTMDLSDLNQVSEFSFPELKDATSVCLINNAGTLGTVSKTGNLDERGIIRGFNVNLVSVAILTNNFMKAYQNQGGKKIILNISSGAGKSPIDGWSIYCASKAGLDMFSRVVAEEQKITGKGFRIFSLAPGIVDTEMQDQIRNSKKEDFSRINDFVDYKKQGELSDPRLVSRKIMFILDNPENFKETVFSVRDF